MINRKMRLHSVNGSDDSDVYSEAEEHVDVEGSVRQIPVLSPADLRVHERLQGDSNAQVQSSNVRGHRDVCLNSSCDNSALQKDTNTQPQNGNSHKYHHTNNSKYSNSVSMEGTRAATRPSFLITDILSSTHSKDRNRDSDSTCSVATTPCTPCTPCTPTLIDLQKTAALLAQRHSTSLPGVSPTGSCDSQDSDADEGTLACRTLNQLYTCCVIL